MTGTTPCEACEQLGRTRVATMVVGTDHMPVCDYHAVLFQHHRRLREAVDTAGADALADRLIVLNEHPAVVYGGAGYAVWLRSTARAVLTATIHEAGLEPPPPPGDNPDWHRQ